MSPLQQGVLRELVLFQAAQAQLRVLQPDQGGERHGTTGGNRPLAVALVHRVNVQVVVSSAGSVAQCKTRMSSTSPSWSTGRDGYWSRALILRKTSSRYHLSLGRELRGRNRLVYLRVATVDKCCTSEMARERTPVNDSRCLRGASGKSLVPGGLQSVLQYLCKQSACIEIQCRRGLTCTLGGAYGVVGLRALKTPVERPPSRRFSVGCSDPQDSHRLLNEHWTNGVQAVCR